MIKFIYNPNNTFIDKCPITVENIESVVAEKYRLFDLNIYEADTTRIAAYGHYHVREKFPVPTTAIVLHLTYKKSENHVLGGISNMDEVEKFFQKKIAV